MSKGKLIQSAKELIETHGELPVEWQCGGGDIWIRFGDWGDGWCDGFEDPSNPNHEILSEVRWLIIEKAGLGGGDDGSQSEANGKIVLDSQNGDLTLLITELLDSDGSPGKEILPGVSLPDAFIWCEINLVHGKVGSYRIDPDVDTEQREKLFSELLVLATAQAGKYVGRSSDVEEVRAMAIQGDWWSKTKSYDFRATFYFDEVERETKLLLG